MTPDPTFWAQWLKPSAGLDTLQWSLLLALAALVGYVFQRHLQMPKVLGYAVVGTLAGLLGFSATTWPLQGPALFALELGVSIILFECGGRITLRWFRHNPMLLVQSLLEAALTYFAVYYALIWLELPPATATPLALIAMAASPVVLTRVVNDTRAAGPVTDRAIALATLSTLYALTLGSAKAEIFARPSASLWQDITPVLVLLGVSVAVAALLCLAMRLALQLMSPTSENTSILMLALIAAATAIAAHLGGSAPLAALLGGMLLKQLHQRPWAWPRQLGTASSLLTLLMFVLVSTVAAQASWSGAVALAVLALVVARLLAKAVGVGLGNISSGASWRQAVWVSCAMAPMSAVALLITSQFAQAAPEQAQAISATALPAILLLELLGAILATLALRRAGETSLKVQAALPTPQDGA
ncbi:cation:proton antiporter [Comamonas aquatica]|uniref:cation:proton antiporter domain-containing protein n=1 Tax=Comamonas aquatica TaxID=225991 RepID=UPI00244A0D69|nr:cation:proton antiporter [Comamonas aquatica]MDH1676144.1 cation:proton antiporter [Comamonas aquatica]MDH1679268.1 cation:proton antiporter [Comamonas aquatica]